MKTGIGLYGENGHQIFGKLRDTDNARVELAALACCRAMPEWPDARIYGSLSELLADERVHLVSLCSPRRADQAADALACLKAGKHVYAEKPCAMTEADLDRIIAAAGTSGRRFHEMAGTAFAQPYTAMRGVLARGVLGEIVQVFAQKSYPPSLERRPQDEAADGGLICQCGVHAIRMIEHVTGLRTDRIHALQTRLGNPERDSGGGLQIAAAMTLTLANGAVGAVTLNYLNPREGFGKWGNEHLRIFGTHGFVEAVDGGQRTRLVIGDRDYGALDVSEPDLDYFQAMIDEVSGTGRMPLSLEDELHPTRMVIRARAAAVTVV